MGTLPHRAMPAYWAGGGYHVVTVLDIDDDRALIGDLADEPIAVPLADFGASRARIRKQKNRLLAIAPPPSELDLEAAVGDGLRACAEGLAHGRMANFTLEAFRTWGRRLHGDTSKEGWASIFPPGRHLWTALSSTYDYIEHYGSGGGLLRPLFAEGLAEAAAALDRPEIAALGERYADLGRAWSELADAALPDGVAAFAEAKRLLDHKAELLTSADPSTAPQLRGAWSDLSRLASEAADDFPLDEAGCDELLRDLQARVLALHADEVSALEALRAAVG
jgi:hypothetical protein